MHRSSLDLTEDTPGFSPPFNRNPFFTGREADIMFMADKLAFSHEGTLPTLRTGMVICGPSGVGKTELVNEFCYRYRQFFQNIFWLQGEYDISAQIAFWGRRMNLPITDMDLEQQVDTTLKTWFQNGPHLVVIDHTEDIFLMEEWVQKLEMFSIIITSRVEEGWQESLRFPSYTLERFSSNASQNVLLNFAPHLANEIDQAPLSNLLDLLEGLPQALNLAGRVLSGKQGLTPDEYLSEIETARMVLSRAIQGLQPENPAPQSIPILALTYAVCWKRLRNQKLDDLTWKLFQVCGYCASNIPVPWEILRDCFSIDHKKSEEKLQQAIDHLNDFGLLIKARHGPIILNQLGEFSRWIESVSEEGSMLPRLSDSLASLVRYSNEQKQTALLETMQFHIDNIASASDRAGFKKNAGALWNSLGYHYWIIKNYEKARLYLERSLKITESLYGSDHSNVAAVVNNLGDVLLSQGQLPAARVSFENAIRIWEKALGSQHLNVAKAASNLAGVMKAQGDLYGAQTNLEKALMILGKEFGNDHPRIASTLTDLGDILLELNELQEANTCFERSLAILETMDPSPRIETAWLADKIAAICSSLLDMETALVYYEKSFLIKSKIMELDDESFIDTTQSLLDTLSQQGLIAPAHYDTEDNIAALNTLVMIHQHLQGEYSLPTAQNLIALGEKIANSNQPAQARLCYEKSLIILYALPESDSFLIADATLRLARLDLADGEYLNAEEHAMRTLSILESVQGPAHAGLLPVLNTLGEIHWGWGNYSQAQEFFMRSIEIGEATFGPNSPKITSSINHLGSVYWSQGNLKQAQACFERALLIDETAYGSHHPNVSRDINNLGDALYRQSDLDGARQCFERALLIEETLQGADHPNVALVINNLGAVLWAQKNLDEARALFERAYQIDETHFGPDHLNVARDARNLGNICKATGNLNEAEQYFLKALSIRQQQLPAEHPKVQAIKDSLKNLYR